MTIRRWRTHFTRLVLIGAMAATVAAGSVAMGPQHEAAAARYYCERIFASAMAHQNTGDVYRSMGWNQQALTSYGMSYRLYDAYYRDCG